MGVYAKNNKILPCSCCETKKKVCFKSILINHEITYDSVMKRHVRSRCPLWKGQGGSNPIISPLSGVPEITDDVIQEHLRPRCPPFKRQGRRCPRHAPPFRRPWAGAKQGGNWCNSSGAKSLRRVPKSPQNVTSTFFSTVNLRLKELRFERGGAKLASCPGRHLISLRPCAVA